MFKQHRRLTTIILATILMLLIGTASVVYYFRYSALIFSANRFLQPYGLTLVSLNDVRIGTSEFYVGAAVIAVDGEDNEHLLRDVTVKYSASQLSNGKIESLQISQLTLSAPFFSMPESAVGEADSEMPFSVLTFLQNFPVRDIRISQIHLPGVSQAAALHLIRSSRDLQIAIESVDLELLAAINWHDQNFVSSHFIDDDHLQTQNLSPNVISGRLQLTKAGAFASTIDFSLIDSPTELDGEMLVIANVAQTLATLETYYNLPDNLPQMSGQLETNVEFTLLKSSLEIPVFTATFNESSALNVREMVGLIPAAGAAEIVLQLSSELVMSVQGNDLDSLAFSIAAEGATMHITNVPDIGTTEITIESLQAQCHQFLTCTSTQELSLAVASFTADNFAMTGLALSGVVTVNNAENGLTVIAEPGLQIGISGGRSNELEIATATINSSSPLTILQSIDGTSLDGSNIALILPFIRVNQKISRAAVNIPALSLNIRDALALDLELIAIDMASELVPVNLRSAVFESQVSLQDNSLEATGKLHMNGQLTVDFDISHQIDTSAGNGVFRVPGLQFDSLWNKLSDFIDPLPINIDLLSGSINGNAELTWLIDTEGAWQLSGPARLQLDGISGLYEEIGFVGARTELAIELLHDWRMRSLASQTFNMTSVDIGFPVEDIRFDYGFNTLQGTYALQNIAANIFEGSISSSGLIYDINADANSMLIELERINIARLLSLAAYDAVAATGLVSGQLPVTLTGSQLTVHAGNLIALAPGGQISYRPADSLAGSGQISSGNANLDLVYEALANYQYQVLQSSVDYLDTGELILGLKLEGFSPNMQSGSQRINLNLNISDNIPALLQSLQASRSITDALELRLQVQ